MIKDGYVLQSKSAQATAKTKKWKSKRNSTGGPKRVSKSKLIARIEEFLANEDEELVNICLKEIIGKGK